MFIGIDVGGTKTVVGLFDQEGKLLKSKRIKTDYDYQDFLDSNLEIIREFTSLEGIQAIGLCVPGRIDNQEDEITVGKLDWKNKRIREDLSKLTNIPTKQVFIENDAKAATLYQARKGPGKNFDLVAYVTLSTGIGMGISHKGELVPALKKAEIGHIYFKNGEKIVRWEDFASGSAFYKRYGDVASNVTDEKIWKEFSDDLAIGFFAIIALISPQIIIIGGGLGAHFESFAPHLQAALDKLNENKWELPEIVLGENPELAGVYGCFEIIPKEDLPHGAN